MDELNKLRRIYELKKVYRANSVENRKESSAEHSWSCLILADYFLSLIKTKINRIRVYELLMYHDIVEIETGDIDLHPQKNNENKQHKEFKAVEKLRKELPEVIGEKLFSLFNEFEENKTVEAKFAMAVDKLDAEIHEMDYKKDWKGWTEEFLRKSKEKYFEDFPEIKGAFEKIMIFLKENNYFNQ